MVSAHEEFRKRRVRVLNGIALGFLVFAVGGSLYKNSHITPWIAMAGFAAAFISMMFFQYGFRCPRCGCRESSPVRAVLLRCRDCRHQTSVTAGTIFQDTRTSLRLWFSSHMVGGQSEELCQRVGAATSAGSEEL